MGRIDWAFRADFINRIMIVFEIKMMMVVVIVVMELTCILNHLTCYVYILANIVPMFVLEKWIQWVSMKPYQRLLAMKWCGTHSSKHKERYFLEERVEWERRDKMDHRSSRLLVTWQVVANKIKAITTEQLKLCKVNTNIFASWGYSVIPRSPSLRPSQRVTYFLILWFCS